MATLAAFHAPAAPGRLRTTVSGILRRLAASPLDSPVLDAIAAQAPAGPPVRMRAHWKAVTTTDGTTRLEATWHPDH
ncbi:hypothetical protein OH807_06230 [Kitasatospora sp. NBC_01560]|uniref:hypothetical protein n=1 Tax=Kitasatospora sp. NBC_01560 TaxID=2975965 RepID=UPI003866FBD9